MTEKLEIEAYNVKYSFTDSTGKNVTHTFDKYKITDLKGLYDGRYNKKGFKKEDNKIRIELLFKTLEELNKFIKLADLKKLLVYIDIEQNVFKEKEIHFKFEDNYIEYMFDNKIDENRSILYNGTINLVVSKGGLDRNYFENELINIYYKYKEGEDKVRIDLNDKDNLRKFENYIETSIEIEKNRYNFYYTLYKSFDKNNIYTLIKRIENLYYYVEEFRYMIKKILDASEKRMEKFKSILKQESLEQEPLKLDSVILLVEPSVEPQRQSLLPLHVGPVVPRRQPLYTPPSVPPKRDDKLLVKPRIQPLSVIRSVEPSVESRIQPSRIGSVAQQRQPSVSQEHQTSRLYEHGSMGAQYYTEEISGHRMYNPDKSRRKGGSRQKTLIKKKQRQLKKYTKKN